MVMSPSSLDRSPGAVLSATQPSNLVASTNLSLEYKKQLRGGDVLPTRTADVIEAEILNCGLLPGTFLGGEQQLATRFRVGRATLRSAIRQLEMLGLVEVRSGKGGGVFVIGDSSDAAANRLSGWFMTLRLRLTDVAWASWILLQFASGLAARRLNDESAARMKEARIDTYVCANALSAYIGRRTKLRLAILQAADNPALLVLFKSLDRTWRETLLPYNGSTDSEKEGVAATRRGDQELIEAILSRGEAGARATAWAIGKAENDRIGVRVDKGNLPSEAVSKTAFVTTSFGGQTLCAMALRALQRDIMHMAPDAKFHLGTLSALSTRYGVSLDVMRETAALAERNGLVTVQRGRNGGIRVREAAVPTLAELPFVFNPAIFKTLQLDAQHLEEMQEVLAYGWSIIRESTLDVSKADLMRILEVVVAEMANMRDPLSNPESPLDRDAPVHTQSASFES